MCIFLAPSTIWLHPTTPLYLLLPPLLRLLPPLSPLLSSPVSFVSFFSFFVFFPFLLFFFCLFLFLSFLSFSFFSFFLSSLSFLSFLFLFFLSFFFFSFPFTFTFTRDSGRMLCSGFQFNFIFFLLVVGCLLGKFVWLSSASGIPLSLSFFPSPSTAAQFYWQYCDRWGGGGGVAPKVEAFTRVSNVKKNNVAYYSRTKFGTLLWNTNNVRTRNSTEFSLANE